MLFLSSSDNLSIFTYCFAISSIGVFFVWANIISANGSNPFALATVALVFFFCLYGLYMSSTSANVLAFSKFATISSVSFPWFSIDVFTSSFLASKLRRYVSLSPKSLKVSSERPPVTSFL